MKKRDITAPANYNWARSRLITRASVAAKRANQRLREIEKQGLEDTSNAYKYLERAAFDGKPWLSTTKKGEMKFNTNFRAMTDEEIQRSLRHINDFLNAKTSLTRGVRTKVSKLTSKFNEKLEEYGSEKKYSEQEFTEIMTENLNKELFKVFDPSEVMKLFAEDPSYSVNAEQILSALVAKEGRTLSSMSFATVKNAFHNWQSNDLEQDEEGELMPWE